jgi:hypothetical protein
MVVSSLNPACSLTIYNSSLAGARLKSLIPLSKEVHTAVT